MPDEPNPVEAIDELADPTPPDDFAGVRDDPAPPPEPEPSPQPSLEAFRALANVAQHPTTATPPAAAPADPYAQFDDAELADLAKNNPKFAPILENRRQQSILQQHRQALAGDIAAAQESVLADTQAFTKYPDLLNTQSAMHKLFMQVKGNLAAGGYSRPDINLQAAEMAHAQMGRYRQDDRAREERIVNGTQFPKPTHVPRDPQNRPKLTPYQVEKAKSLGIEHPDDQALVADNLKRSHDRLVREGRI